MLSFGNRVAVAVSGGADSVCLLHVLSDLRSELAIDLSVVHVNHQLRGECSDDDARFVADLCRSLGLMLHLRAVDVRALGGNMEEMARESRQAVFEDLLQAGKVDWVATGHTSNDQAETVLYRLLRGSGTAGLASILPVAGRIARPLLEVERADILEYLRLRGITWREDLSNLNLQMARNRIRHRLLPMLVSDHNPQVVKILSATAALARDEQDFWDREVDAQLARLVQVQAGAALINIDALESMHVALQRRVLRRAIERVKGDLRGISLLNIEQMRELLKAPTGHGRLQVSGIDVFRSFHLLKISAIRTSSRKDLDYSFRELSPPCRIQLPNNQSIIEMAVVDTAVTQGRFQVYNRDNLLDFDRLEKPLELRNWQPGDRMERAENEQKIKELFQQERIPMWDRQGWPILISGGKIAWARHFGVARPFTPNAQSRTYLHVRERTGLDSVEPNNNL